MTIDFHRRFKKRYKKLPQSIQKAFEKRLLIFIDDPHAEILENHELNPPWGGCRSIRINGDFRAIFQLRKAGSVFFLRIGTHSELYNS